MGWSLTNTAHGCTVATDGVMDRKWTPGSMTSPMLYNLEIMRFNTLAGSKERIPTPLKILEI